MSFKQLIVLTAIVAAVPVVSAQSVVTPGARATGTVTIKSIDAANRKITATNDKKQDQTFSVPVTVTGFSTFKVGDKLNINYYDSTVYMMVKPGGSAPAPSTTTAGTQKQTVIVKAIDVNAPSITVSTPEGVTETRKVQERTRLNEVKVGDQIEITFSDAVLISASVTK